MQNGPYRLDELGWLQFERLSGLVLAREAGLADVTWQGRADRGRVAMIDDGVVLERADIRLRGPLAPAVVWARPSSPVASTRLGDVLTGTAAAPAELGAWFEQVLVLTNIDAEEAQNALVQRFGRKVKQFAVLGAGEIGESLDRHADLRAAMPSVLGLRDLDPLISRNTSGCGTGSGRGVRRLAPSGGSVGRCCIRHLDVVYTAYSAIAGPRWRARTELGRGTMTTITARGEQSVQGASQIEIRSIDYVPVSERHGKPWHLGPVWFQGNAQLSTLAVGAIGVSVGLNLIWALIAIVAGALIGTLFMAFHSAQGPKLGLPQMIQSRAQFGYFGSLLPVVVAVMLFIGFNVFNTILGGDVIQELFPGLHSKLVAYLPVVILSVALTVFGYELIHIGLRWATWLFIVVYGVFTIGSLFTVGAPHGAFDLGKWDTGLFLVQFGAVVSYQLTWAPYVSEYSRYLPPETKTSTVFWWTYWGSNVGAIPMLVGAFILSAATTAEPVARVHDVANQIFSGFGPIIMILSIPGLVAVTAMNMYSGGLSTLTTVDTIKRIRPTFTARWLSIGFITVVATVLSLTLSSNFLGNFNQFLLFVLYFMIPWTAVNLIDFFFVRKGNYAIRELFIPRGMYGAWSWRGLTAYLIGFAAMIPFMYTNIWKGWVAKSLSGGDISPFIGFPVAALVYYLFSRSIDVAAEARVAEEQKTLLEAEALAHEEIGEQDAFEVGARVSDEFEAARVERHPGA